MSRPRTSAASCEIVFSRGGDVIFTFGFEAISPRSSSVAFRAAVTEFRRTCPGLALTDDVTIQFRKKAADPTYPAL